MSNQDKDGAFTPDFPHMPSGRTYTTMRGSNDFRLIDHSSIRRDIDPYTCFWESIDKFPARQSIWTRENGTYDVLYRACRNTGPEPLPNFRPELLSDKSHAVDTKRTCRLV